MAKGARSYMVKLNGTEYLADARTYQEGPVQALALKTSEGDPKYGDMSHLSNYVQSDWRGGRAEDRAESGNRFYDSEKMLTYIHGQISPTLYATLLGLTSIGLTTIVVGAADYRVNESLAAAADTPNGVWSKLSQEIYPLATQAVTKVALLLCTGYNDAFPDSATSLTLRVETDSSGSPSGTLVHANATASLSPNLTPIPRWHEFTFAGSFTLTLNTKYHVVLSGSGTDANPRWILDTTGGGARYGQHYDGATWATATYTTSRARRLFFSESVDLVGAPIAGIVFNSVFYLAAGTGLYKWDSGSLCFTAVKTDFATDITDLDVLDNVLWIARGSGNTVWTMNTAESFTEQTGVLGQLLYVFDGYLYRANANDLYYYDGTVWSAAMEVGDDTQNITGLTGLNKSLLIARPDGLWGYTSGPWVYNIIRWDSQLDANNGTGMCEWNGAVYIPVKYGLVKYDGNSFTNVGPDQDEGLPSDRTGKIVSMVPLLNYLIAVVDNTSATGYGSVMLYTGRGWHEVARAPWAGSRVRMAAFDWDSSPTRLWFGFGNIVAWVEFSDVAENPTTYTNSGLEVSGSLETSWITGGLLSHWKIASELWINAGYATSNSAFYSVAGNELMRIEVDYQTDRSGLWVHASAVLQVGGVSIDLKNASTITATTVSSIATDGTVTVAAIGTIAKGLWVTIANETRQVKSVSGNTFKPTVPYEYAAAGDTVDDGYPSFREIKFRIRFHASGGGNLIRAMRFAYAVQLTALWRWSFEIMVGDYMVRPDGTRDTRTAAQIRTGLKELAKETNRLVNYTSLYDGTAKVQLVKMEGRAVSYAEDGTPDIESRFKVDLVEM